MTRFGHYTNVALTRIRYVGPTIFSMQSRIVMAVASENEHLRCREPQYRIVFSIVTEMGVRESCNAKIIHCTRVISTALLQKPDSEFSLMMQLKFLPARSKSPQCAIGQMTFVEHTHGAWCVRNNQAKFDDIQNVKARMFLVQLELHFIVSAVRHLLLPLHRRLPISFELTCFNTCSI